MASIKENVEQLNKMILGGDILGAFEKFYAEDVVMQDNDTPLRVGKKVCREYEEAFVNNLTEFRSGEVKNTLISEEAGVATVEWAFDYSHKEWGDMNYTQVAVQTWKDGQIVNEKFIYKS
ncbi:nuclear transport factor 2 family protein [Flammeovirgaceae bacterium SG7u.111]|nr:nuclear transport factor 2 family protein [Flammeovirgaceae bacterium SG7u.132]WPO34212.1 nuclear transport factor 2 family protein [Flammeovirgaceae bacterium SG7u.111]